MTPQHFSPVFSDNRPLGLGAWTGTLLTLWALLALALLPIPLGITLWSWLTTGDYRPADLSKSGLTFAQLVLLGLVFGIGLTSSLPATLPHRTSLGHDGSKLIIRFSYVAGFRSHTAIPLPQVSDIRLVRPPASEDSSRITTDLMIMQTDGHIRLLPLYDPGQVMDLSVQELGLRAALYPTGWSSQSGNSAIDPSTTSAA